MVIYDLICSNSHTFEGWFKNSDDFAKQVSSKLLCCPICDSGNIKRKLSTLNVVSSVSRSSRNNPVNKVQKSTQTALEKTKATPNPDLDAAKKAVSELMRMVTPEEKMEVVRDFVEKNFEDVGADFSEEVRKIHYGETEQRGIHGQATAEEVADLEEEGISTLSIPAAKSSGQLN